MRYAIIGTGAIGGYYGGMLARSGCEVHFLAHSDYAEMRQSLTVDSCNGDFVINQPNVYKSTADMPEVDAVIVALKTVNNDKLPALLAPLMASQPAVLLIQNGLCVEHDLAQLVPGIKLIAGLAFICSTKLAPAHIQHQDYGRLTLASYSCDDETVQRIDLDLQNAGVETDREEYNYARWRKAIWNLPFNGLSVVTGLDTLALIQDPEHEKRIRAIMHEVVSIANALGVATLQQANIDRNIDDTRSMKPYLPSMRVDFDNHRPMEIYYLYTRAIQQASRLGVPCPELTRLEAQLRNIAHQ